VTNPTSIGQSFTPIAGFTLYGINIWPFVSGTPGGSLFIEVAAGSITGSAIATSNSIACSSFTGTIPPNSTVRLFVFNPIPLTSGATYYLRIVRTTTDTVNYPLVCVETSNAYSGGQYYSHDGVNWNGVSGFDLRFEVIGLDALVTKLQEQYLITNTLVPAGTALQKLLINWDSTEWGGVTNAYSFQVNAANGSTSAIQLRTADDATLVATVTSPDNAGSGVATMP